MSLHTVQYFFFSVFCLLFSIEYHNTFLNYARFGLIENIFALSMGGEEEARVSFLIAKGQFCFSETTIVPIATTTSPPVVSIVVASAAVTAAVAAVPVPVAAFVASVWLVAVAP